MLLQGINGFEIRGVVTSASERKGSNPAGFQYGGANFSEFGNLQGEGTIQRGTGWFLGSLWLSQWQGTRAVNGPQVGNLPLFAPFRSITDKGFRGYRSWKKEDPSPDS